MSYDDVSWFVSAIPEASLLVVTLRDQDKRPLASLTVPYADWHQIVAAALSLMSKLPPPPLAAPLSAVEQANLTAWVAGKEVGDV